MSATFETHATASHRYYMRKTKSEIVQRIRDMLKFIPQAMIEAKFRSDYAAVRPGRFDPTFASLVLFNLVYNGSDRIGFELKHYTKYELAAGAMLAHDLIGKIQSMPELESCAADCDDHCAHPKCPQLRDGEPGATGRHCPLHNPSWRDGEE